MINQKITVEKVIITSSWKRAVKQNVFSCSVQSLKNVTVLSNHVFFTGHNSRRRRYSVEAAGSSALFSSDACTAHIRSPIQSFFSKYLRFSTHNFSLSGFEIKTAESIYLLLCQTSPTPLGHVRFSSHKFITGPLLIMQVRCAVYRVVIFLFFVLSIAFHNSNTQVFNYYSVQFAL